MIDASRCVTSNGKCSRVSTAKNEKLNLSGHTVEALAALEKNLVDLGSDKSRILSANVYLANIDDKPSMDEIWKDWIGNNPDH